jgi:MFS family permease
METRALAIAFFYATGTALGGITGPFLFGKMIESGEASQVAIAFFLGAAVMAVGGIVELFFGVKAEQMALEDIAKPLTAQDAEADGRTRPRRSDGGSQRAAPRARPRGRGGRARARARA